MKRLTMKVLHKIKIFPIFLVLLTTLTQASDPIITREDCMNETVKTLKRSLMSPFYERTREIQDEVLRSHTSKTYEFQYMLEYYDLYWGHNNIELNSDLLHHAAIYNNPTLMNKLIKNKVDLNASTRTGLTALHHAIIYQQAKMAQLLINAGANINAQAQNGWTPLHWAADVNEVQIVAMLLRAKADLNIKDPYYNETALDIANQLRFPTIKNMILDAKLHPDKDPLDLNSESVCTIS